MLGTYHQIRRAVVVGCAATLGASLVGAALAGAVTDQVPEPVLVAARRGHSAPAGHGEPGSSLEGIGIAVRTAQFAGGMAVARQNAAAEAEVARIEAELAVRYQQEAELERQGAVLDQVSDTIDRSQSDYVPAEGHTPCAIPAYICERESGGDPTVYNTSGSGASGKYQAMPGTWGGYGGYANAADAPESVQDEWAAQLWDGGAGCSHWSACG